ncbi:Protein of unknown function [Sulfitobacter marinus]|uniref:DUF1826 domain-containing protein n=1 Tax=Sulfitobacter marinus TaxID=394264 RepID=A0A1I6RWK4_9RHOB|nr:DUF1826 domain-containing protein [Sulfitobacter marinus]SFS69095.1 Protein of unknown function [Sulfitobacter marinus]
MIYQRDTLSAAAIGVGIVQTGPGLDVINTGGCAAAIWHRRPTPSLQSWIGAMAPSLLPQVRLTLRPETVREAVLQACVASGTPDCPERAILIDDIAAQAEIFTALMPSRYLRVRLDVIETNACRKFHIDAVTVRLVCTYRGTGTQYGNGAKPSRVFTVPTGSPILLRGTLWPETPRSGLSHRSPPIEGTGETRLVLVIDPVDDPEDAV